LNVDESPHEPGHKAAELNAGALQHCETLAHNGKIAFIEITKWCQGRMTDHSAEDGLSCIPALLHRYLRDPGEGPPVLIERCRVSYNKNVRMIGNCKVGLNSNAARTVHSTSEPFSRRRRGNAGRPYYRLCLDALIS
jgi:hypothetical protein